MVFRYRTEDRDELFVIEDLFTGDCVSLSKADADSILNGLEGVSYSFVGRDVFIVNGDRKFSIDIKDLNVIVRNGIGVVGMSKTISYGCM